MSLENDLSYEEMQEIRTKELSNLIIDSYKDANLQITFSKESNVKLKWTYAQINSEKQSYLIYLDKYMKGDKSLFKSIRNYLSDYYNAETCGNIGLNHLKLYSDAQKAILFKYATIVTVAVAFIAPIMGVPAVVMSVLYVKKSSKLKKRFQKIELDAAFKEAALEELRELKEEYLESALNIAKDKFKK